MACIPPKRRTLALRLRFPSHPFLVEWTKISGYVKSSWDPRLCKSCKHPTLKSRKTACQKTRLWSKNPKLRGLLTKKGENCEVSGALYIIFCLLMWRRAHWKAQCWNSSTTLVAFWINVETQKMNIKEEGIAETKKLSLFQELCSFDSQCGSVVDRNNASSTFL